MDPLAAFRRLIEDGFNTGDLDAIDEVVSPDMIEHQFAKPGVPAPKVGPRGVKAIVMELRRGSDDLHLEIEDIALQGDTVWARIRATGTDTGGQLGLPPSNRPIDITVIDVVRYVDGLAVEHWGVPDRFAVLQQTGHLQAPAGA